MKIVKNVKKQVKIDQKYRKKSLKVKVWQKQVLSAENLSKILKNHWKLSKISTKTAKMQKIDQK